MRLTSDWDRATAAVARLREELERATAEQE